MIFWKLPRTQISWYFPPRWSSCNPTATFCLVMLRVGLCCFHDQRIVEREWGGIELVSHAISESLGIPCYSMMSAHSAMEMAQGKLCEVTIGCSDNSHSKLLISAMQTNNCRVISVNDVDGVELCGTLTDVVALGAGFIDGLRLGENARLAAIHLGVKEIMRFIKTFFPSSKMSTFYESCGVTNAVASSFGMYKEK